MVKVNIYGLMVESTMESGLITYKMVKVDLFMLMESFILEIGWMEIKTDKGLKFGKMDLSILVTGLTTLWKEKVTTNFQMEVNIKEVGLIINSMVMESKHGLMEDVMRDNFIMELRRAKVYILGLTVRSMMDIGKMENNTERVASPHQRET